MRLAKFRQLALIRAMGALLSNPDYTKHKFPPKQVAHHAVEYADALVGANTVDDRAIKVWAWADAPEELKALSGNGGDEEWLAELPEDVDAGDVPWLREGGPFGCGDVTAYVHQGRTIVIGAHA